MVPLTTLLRAGRIPTLVAFILIGTVAVRADYALSAGDVIEISVNGIPDLKSRVMIDVDGRIAVPIIGSIHAAGLPIHALRGKLQHELSKRAISIRGSDGKTIISPIAPEEISVLVAEYRPVYVSGDVAKAGEIPYRPGLTVRQAIVNAGGYDVVRFRISNPYLEAVDFAAEEKVLQNDLAQAKERESQILAELDYEVGEASEARIATDGASGRPIARSVIAEQYRAQREDFEKEVAHLLETGKRLAARAALLSEQKAKEDESVKMEAEAFERAQALLGRRAASPQQVVDARRAMLLSASRAIQTGADAAQAAIARDDIARAVQKLHDQRRIRLLSELQESRANIQKIETRLNAIKDKLLLTGSMRSFWTKGATLKSEIWVHRSINGATEQLLGSETMSLLPGDVVEITLHVP